MPGGYTRARGSVGLYCSSASLRAEGQAGAGRCARRMIASAWRAAVLAVAGGTPANQARRALLALRVVTPA